MWLLFQKISDSLFPRYCIHCHQILLPNEQYLCDPCWLKIPRTHFGETLNNAPNCMLEKFNTHTVQQATALMVYEKGGLSQTIIHHIKYKQAAKLGINIGEYFCNIHSYHPIFKEVDYLIPIPLHPKRFKERGYNQSALIAQGIHNKLKIPVDTSHLIRCINNPSQTNKTPQERIENTSTIFEFIPNSKFENKTLLIIDDVMTTGATLKAAIQTIQNKQKVKIRVLTLAYAL